MPIGLKRAYLEEIRFRYRNSTKKQKGKILDEFCEVCKYTRKHAIKILKGELQPRIRRSGPKSKYQREDVLAALKELWNLMSGMCSKKMVAAFVDWLPFYDARDEVKELLMQISASTIDRLLRAYRSPLTKGKSTTKPSMIKSRVPIKLLDGDITMPGYLEADTVAHCGNSAAGEFASSITAVDLCSGWTENRAVWTKTAEKMLPAMRDIEESLPFTLIGIATDNGNEFLNETILDYFQKRNAPVNVVKRRAYKKNDNAHVEQRNYTHVRQLFGYDRVEEKELVLLMNEIYRAYWNPIQNYFTPVLKLTSKERIGGRIKKKYDKPKTPYRRLMENPYVPEKEKAQLRDNYRTKNPIYLKKEMEKKLKVIFDRVEELKRRNRFTGT